MGLVLRLFFMKIRCTVCLLVTPSRKNQLQSHPFYVIIEIENTAYFTYEIEIVRK